MPSLTRASVTLALGIVGAACSSQSTNPGDGNGSEPVETIATITSDADDGVWLAGTNENLRTGADDQTIEVGNDFEGARAGLRFQLPVPRRAHVTFAVIELHRVMGPAENGETVLIQVFDDANVPPFDDAHVHTPAEHVPGGLLPDVIGGFAVGEQDEKLTSPDVRDLVQHVVDRDDWSETGFLGFVLAPDSLTTWASFRDSAAGVGARLRVKFTPP